jgi:hypothetical protein
MPGKADTDHPCQAKLLRSFDRPTTNSRLRDQRPVSAHRCSTAVSRHRSLDTLRGYVRRVGLFKEHTVAAFLHAGICTASIPIMHSGD